MQANPPPSNSEVWNTAKEFVRQQLKSPSTANFDSTHSDYQDPDDCVLQTGQYTYTVRGWVDGQNAFGGTVRNNFVCKLRYAGDDKWVCEGVEFSH